MNDLLSKTKLDRLADAVIRELAARAPDVREGVVMTAGVASYRRLDCDGRALAYVRTRARKRLVRIDVSGLWLAGHPTRLAAANAGGAVTLVLRDAADGDEAVAFLARVVEDTRASHAPHVRGRAVPRTGGTEPC